MPLARGLPFGRAPFFVTAHFKNALFLDRAPIRAETGLQASSPTAYCTLPALRAVPWERQFVWRSHTASITP
jgi:hypothetical protein